jgi:hypothetical protein
VRLGGIYALERIVNDSPDDRAIIIEVLTAFVRTHAPWPPKAVAAVNQAARLVVMSYRDRLSYEEAACLT